MTNSTHEKPCDLAFEVAITDSQLAMIVFTALKDTEQLDEDCFDTKPLTSAHLNSEEEYRLVDLVSLIMSYPDMSEAIVCNRNTDIYVSSILVENNLDGEGIADGIAITPYLDSISQQGHTTKQPTLIYKKISRSLLGESDMLAMQLTSYTMAVLRTVACELTTLVDYYAETFGVDADVDADTHDTYIELPMRARMTTDEINAQLARLISPHPLSKRQTNDLETLISEIIDTVRDSYTLALIKNPRISDVIGADIDTTVNDAIGNNWF